MNIDGGSLELVEGSHRGDGLNMEEAHLVVNGGRLELLQNVTRVNGLLQLNQGEIVHNMAGVGGDSPVRAALRWLVAASFQSGQPTNVLVVDVDMSI